jgi:hypothetical protein
MHEMGNGVVVLVVVVTVRVVVVVVVRHPSFIRSWYLQCLDAIYSANR